MWSSTASTASTIPHDENWAFPVESEILNTCYKEDRDFYVPTEEFDKNFVFNVFGKAKKKKNIPSDIEEDKKVNNITDNKFNLEYLLTPNTLPTHSELINEWAKKKLYNDKRTLEEINKDEKVNKKNRKLALKNYFKRDIPCYIPNYPEYDKLPYFERSYCYPKIMCHLGWGPVSTKTILHYVQNGILLFLIDIRFGIADEHKKIVENLLAVRQTLSKGVYAERIFGFAFQIHGRKLQLGLIYKDQKVFLDQDSIIILTADRRWSRHGSHFILYVNFWDYLPILQVGDEIKIGDRIIVIINGKNNCNIICTVKRGGLAEKRMSLLLPINRRINSLPDITKEEEEDIGLAIHLGCDYLLSPCVTTKLISHVNWVVAVRTRIVIILQMITNYNQLTKDTIDEIFNLAHGVVIYGDGKNENYKLRDYFVSQSFAKHKLIVRAGFMNKKNCIHKYDQETLKHLLLYSDCIVCSPSSYDITDIRTYIRNLYPDMNLKNFQISLGHLCSQDKSLENIFCKYIVSNSYIGKISFIVVVNNNGEFVKLLAERRPLVPIIASFLDLPTARSCLISRNVYSTMYTIKKSMDWNEQLSLRLRYCINYAKMIGCIHRNDPFLFCYDSEAGLKYCDTARILLTNNYLLKLISK